MKPTLIKMTIMLALAASLSACSMSERERNTAIGAGVGAAAGHLVGGDTGSTLGGAALGAVVGNQIYHRRHRR